jgi:hypothetical protein
MRAAGLVFFWSRRMGGHGSGRGGLSPSTVRQVERLLVERYGSNRAIARSLGIGEATVRAIARGEHFSQLDVSAVKYARCGCGALTDQQPCRLCLLRAAGL